MTESTGSATPARNPGEPGVPGDDVMRPARGLRRRRGRGGGRAEGDVAPGAADLVPVEPNVGEPLAREVAPGPHRGNPVAWTSLLVAIVLTIWQAVYALSVQGVATPDQDLYFSVSLFVTLVLGLAAAVLGVVGIAQRRRPRWPALAGLAVGLNAFLVAVFAWIGGLMNIGA